MSIIITADYGCGLKYDYGVWTFPDIQATTAIVKLERIIMMERKRPRIEEQEDGKKEKLAKTDLRWLVECICD